MGVQGRYYIGTKDVSFDNKIVSPSFMDLFNQNKTGIIGGVSIAKVKDIVIPLQPLMEQQRIVAQIDGLFEQLR